MDVYEHGYQHYELARRLAERKQRRPSSTRMRPEYLKGDDMDHGNFMFYLDLVQRDVRRKLRHEAEDPRWTGADRGGRWVVRARALPRRLVHSMLAGARQLHVPFPRRRRQPTVSE